MGEKERFSVPDEGEWLAAIEDARQGRLSPHWQKVYLEEMRGRGDAARMQLLLQGAIRSRPQITDEEEARRGLEQAGAKLLFFFERDYKTMAELVFVPRRGIYRVYLALDLCQPAAGVQRDARLIETKLDGWRAEQGICFDKAGQLCYWVGGVRLGFDSLEQALAYLYAMLRRPDLL